MASREDSFQDTNNHPLYQLVLALLNKGIPDSFQEEINCVPSAWCQKSSAEASRLRSLGNNAYQSKNYEEAIMYYSKSVAAAPTDSEELALAYGNRSAVLQFQKKYELCLLDSNRALNGCLAPNSRQKLLERKAISYEKLQAENVMKSKLREVSTSEGNNIYIFLPHYE